MMSAVDKRDKSFFDRQKPELQKTFAAPVALRWTSAVSGPQAEAYLICTNEFANANFHDLYEYPDLQFRLLTLVGSGKPQRHEWIPIAKQGRSISALHDFMARFHPLASPSEIDLLLDLHDRESFAEFVNQSGCSPEETKDFISAFNKSAEPKKAKR